MLPILRLELSALPPEVAYKWRPAFAILDYEILLKRPLRLMEPITGKLRFQEFDNPFLIPRGFGSTLKLNDCLNYRRTREARKHLTFVESKRERRVSHLFGKMDDAAKNGSPCFYTPLLHLPA